MKFFQSLFGNKIKLDNIYPKMRSESGIDIGCPKCGGLSYEHDNYFGHYICAKCGWLTETAPNGVDKTKIMERQRANKTRVDKYKNKELPTAIPRIMVPPKPESEIITDNSPHPEDISVAVKKVEEEARIDPSITVRKIYLSQLMGDPVIAWSTPNHGSLFNSDRAREILTKHISPLGYSLSGPVSSGDPQDSKSRCRFYWYKKTEEMISSLKDEGSGNDANGVSRYSISSEGVITDKKTGIEWWSVRIRGSPTMRRRPGSIAAISLVVVGKCPIQRNWKVCANMPRAWTSITWSLFSIFPIGVPGCGLNLKIRIGRGPIVYPMADRIAVPATIPPESVRCVRFRGRHARWQNNATDISRYSVSSEGVIADNTTGLEWVVGPDQDINYDEAQVFVKGCKIAGGGWRLPTQRNCVVFIPKGWVNTTWPQFSKHLDGGCGLSQMVRMVRGTSIFKSAYGLVLPQRKTRLSCFNSTLRKKVALVSDLGKWRVVTNSINL